MRLDRNQLRYMALMALEDVADRYRDEPCDRALWLRFLLAWLYQESGADPESKWMFTAFWTAATRSVAESSRLVDGYARHTSMEASLNGITRELGWERTASFMHEMQERRRARGRGEAKP